MENYIADENGKAIKNQLFLTLKNKLGLSEESLTRIIEDGVSVPDTEMRLEIEEIIEMSKIIECYQACMIKVESLVLKLTPYPVRISVLDNDTYPVLEIDYNRGEIAPDGCAKNFIGFDMQDKEVRGSQYITYLFKPW